MLLKRTLLPVSMICLLLLNTQITFAEPNSLESQNIQENKVKYEQLDEETIKLDADINKLNADIESLNSDLENNNLEIQDTKTEINTIKNKIEEAKFEIEKKQGIVDKRLRSMYKSSMTTDMIVYLVNSENLFDMLDRVQAMSKIVSVDKQMVTEINEKKDLLDEDAEKVVEKQNYLLNLQKCIENDLSEVNTKKEDQQRLLSDLNSRKDEFMSVIEANEEKLISYQISVINSDYSSVSEVKEALNMLQDILPQLNSNYVIGLANNSIEIANEKIALSDSMEANSDSTEATSNSVGNASNYLATYSMVATAYTGGSFTALGTKPVYNPNGLSTVSVDPSVIPLGSKVYVDGYGYAIASDTGGAIKGNKIDLYMNSESQCFAFGRKTVTVNVIAYPGQW